MAVVEQPIADMTDAELNAAAAIEVMGWWQRQTFPGEDPVFTWALSDNLKDDRPTTWSPSTDIAAAFEVVERILKTLRLDVDIMRGHPRWNEWLVQFSNEPTRDGVTLSARNASLPRAICEAALAAVRANL